MIITLTTIITLPIMMLNDNEDDNEWKIIRTDKMAKRKEKKEHNALNIQIV